MKAMIYSLIYIYLTLLPFCLNYILLLIKSKKLTNSFKEKKNDTTHAQLGGERHGDTPEKVLIVSPLFRTGLKVS